MNLFFCNNLFKGEVFLNEEESFHCIKVLRLNAGDEVHLIDGQGTFAKASLTNTDYKKCAAMVTDITPEFNKRNYRLHIGMAPTKNMERFEWFLEKAVELGVDEITPLLCSRSHRDRIREDRLEKIIVSAVKQSIQAYIPKLNPLTKFNDALKNSNAALKLIAACTEVEKAFFAKAVSSTKNVFVLIGPEGDFTSDEILIANQNGFTTVSLGSTTLRSETAGLYVCAAMRSLNEI